MLTVMEQPVRKIRSLDELKASSLIWEFLIEAFHITSQDLKDWKSMTDAMAWVVAVMLIGLLATFLPEAYAWGLALLILGAMLSRRAVIFLIIQRLK